MIPPRWSAVDYLYGLLVALVLAIIVRGALVWWEQHRGEAVVEDRAEGESGEFVRA